MFHSQEPVTDSDQLGVAQYDLLPEPASVQAGLFHWIPRPQHWVYIGWFGGMQIVSRRQRP